MGGRSGSGLAAGRGGGWDEVVVRGLEKDSEEGGKPGVGEVKP